MGLYDDLNAQVRGGPVDSTEYWAARATAEMLDDALKTEQPWNAIAAFLPIAMKRFEEALALYPNHQDLLIWNARAIGVEAEVDPDYGNDWGPGFPWSQSDFRKGWGFLEHARFVARELDPPNWQTVRVEARKARGALEKCYNVHEWPERFQTFLAEGLKDAEDLADIAFRKIHGGR